MLNIERIFECLKNITKERKVIVSCHDNSVNKGAFLSDVDERFRVDVIKSIDNIKKEMLIIQQLFKAYEPCKNCHIVINCDVSSMGPEMICFDTFKMDMEKYERFLEKYLKSELFVDQIDLFVERFISVVYTKMQQGYRNTIKSKPTLKSLLAL